MAEDPRLILHFKTFAKFNEKLADGTINKNKHFCIIQDKNQFWVRDHFIDGKVFDVNEVYNDWDITQTDSNTITITLKGLKWDDVNRVWNPVEYPLVINSATQSIAGLQSAADKLKEDNITKTNHVISNPITTETSRTIKLTAQNPADMSDASSSIDIPSATLSEAGLMSATDKKAVDNLHADSWSHIKDTDTFTATASDVSLNYTCRDTNMTSSTDSTEHSQPIGAVSFERAGVMTTADYTKLYTTIPTEIKDLIIGCIAEGCSTAAEAKAKLEAIGSDYSTLNKVAEKLRTFLEDHDLADSTINKWQEIEDFLSGITDQQTLLGIINDTIDSLDVTDSAITGKVVVSVSETDGKVSNAKEFIKNIALTEYTSTGESGSLQIAATDTVEGAFQKVETYIKGLDVNNSLGSGEYASSISETNGKIAVGKANVSEAPLNNYAKGTSDAAVVAADSIRVAIGKLENQVGTEVTNRQNAIAALDAEIQSTDGKNVQVKVTEVDGKITAVNITDASINQSDLNTAISGVNGTLDSKVSELQTSISNEATARSNADTALQNNITAELTRATTAEGQLLTNINSETQARQSADTALTNSVNTKITGVDSSADGQVILFNGTTGKASKAAGTVGNTITPIYLNNGVPVALGYTIQTSVPENAVFTDTTYKVATSTSDGLMSAADKIKLDGLSDFLFTLPIASATTLGGVKIGSGISITTDGTISANTGDSLPEVLRQLAGVLSYNSSTRQFTLNASLMATNFFKTT